LQDFNELLEIQFRGYQNDVYQLELEVGPQHLHSAGHVHGGVFLSLLDTVMSRAVRAYRPEHNYAPTVQLSGNFFRPLSDGAIYAEGRVLNSSRKTVFAEGKLYDHKRRLLAQGSATFIVVDQATLA
jgi:uncharacterized protein (TIGR00369 family)